MPARAYIDLHCHTSASFDSLAAPGAVVRAAAARGLTHLAITDHDRIDGALEARTLAASQAPELTVIVSEVLQAITSHRADGQPLALEAGILRVADALDMAEGRSRIPFEKGRVSMHSLSAAAIDDVSIADGESRPVKIEIVMGRTMPPPTP